MRISRTFSRILFIGCIVVAAVPTAFGQGGGGGGRGGRGGFGGGFGGGSMLSLLATKEVREELKMDEDQTKEYEAANKEMRDEMMAQFGGGRGGPGGPGGGGAGGGGAGGPGGGPGGAGGAGGPGGAAGGRGAGGRGGAGGGGFGAMSTADREKMRENMAAMSAKSEAKLSEILDPNQMNRLVGLYLQRDGVRTFSSKTVSTSLEITAEQKTKIAEFEASAGEEMRAAMTPTPGADFREVMEKLRKDGEEKTMAVLTAAQKANMEKLKGAKFEFPAPPPRGGPGGGRGSNTQ